MVRRLGSAVKFISYFFVSLFNKRERSELIFRAYNRVLFVGILLFKQCSGSDVSKNVCYVY